MCTETSLNVTPQLLGEGKQRGNVVFRPPRGFFERGEIRGLDGPLVFGGRNWQEGGFAQRFFEEAKNVEGDRVFFDEAKNVKGDGVMARRDVALGGARRAARDESADDPAARTRTASLAAQTLLHVSFTETLLHNSFTDAAAAWLFGEGERGSAGARRA